MSGLIKIAIIDDNVTIRSGMCLLLSSIQDFCVMSQAGLVESLRVIFDEPDIVLLRLEQKESQKILRLINHIHQDQPSTKVLVMANSYNDPLVLRSLKAGVHGCLVKESSPQDLETAIREIAGGKLFIPRSVTTKLLQHQPEILDRNGREAPFSLPVQQLRVLQLISQGYSNDEIAKTLFLSKRTVDMHAYRLFKRLNVTSRTQAVQVAQRIGLIDQQDPADEMGSISSSGS